MTRPKKVPYHKPPVVRRSSSRPRTYDILYAFPPHSEHLEAMTPEAKLELNQLYGKFANTPLFTPEELVVIGEVFDATPWIQSKWLPFFIRIVKKLENYNGNRRMG